MRCLLIAFACLVTTAAHAASTPRQDALLESYFAIWDDNRNLTPDTLAKLYARQVVYYGHAMSQDELYRDKLAFIRRWPERRYTVAPGTATRRCDQAETTCTLTATLAWVNRSPAGARSGRSRITLALAREDGALKIVREGAVTLR